MKSRESAKRVPSSHPTRGAWIEIFRCCYDVCCLYSRTPPGVRGLKFLYRISERRRFVSVSYTHLDVYKRQKHGLAAVRGAGRNFRKPPNRCRPRDISGSRTTRGGERHSRTPVPTARARFVRYSWLPAESRQTAAADMGSSTTRGESGAAEHLRPLPRTACPRSPAESRYATFAIAWLSGSARCRALSLIHI